MKEPYANYIVSNRRFRYLDAAIDYAEEMFSPHAMPTILRYELDADGRKNTTTEEWEYEHGEYRLVVRREGHK